MPSSSPRPSKPTTSRNPVSRGKLLFEIYRRTKLGVMPAGCKLVLLILADFANEVGVAWPSHDALMAACGCSIGSIKAAIDKLEDHGWIEVLSVGSGRESSRYRVQLGRPIAVDKGVSEAVGRYKATLIRREIDRRLKAGEDATSEAEVAADLFTSDGLIDSIAGCQPESPSLPAGDPDLLRDPPSEASHLKTNLSVGERARSESQGEGLPVSHGPPTEPSPTTSRSATLKPSSSPTPTPRPGPVPPPKFIPGPSAVPGKDICTSKELLSWVGLHPCLAALVPDQPTADRWGADMHGVFFSSGARSVDVFESVLMFVSQHSDRCREMSPHQLKASIGKYLKNAKFYGEVARKAKEEREMRIKKPQAQNSTVSASPKAGSKGLGVAW